MLATLVTELAPALTRRVEKRVSDLGRLPSPKMRGKLPYLISSLAEALARGRVETVVRPGPDLEFDTEAFLLVVRLLRESLYELLEERSATISPLELNVVSTWFVTLTEKALRGE